MSKGHGMRQAMIELGYAWDEASGRWCPPGQLFGELPQTAGRHEGRRRVLVEVKQQLLALLGDRGRPGDGGA